MLKETYFTSTMSRPPLLDPRLRVSANRLQSEGSTDSGGEDDHTALGSDVGSGAWDDGLRWLGDGGSGRGGVGGSRWGGGDGGWGRPVSGGGSSRGLSSRASWLRGSWSWRWGRSGGSWGGSWSWCWGRGGSWGAWDLEIDTSGLAEVNGELDGLLEIGWVGAGLLDGGLEGGNECLVLADALGVGGSAARGTDGTESWTSSTSWELAEVLSSSDGRESESDEGLELHFGCGWLIETRERECDV